MSLSTMSLTQSSREDVREFYKKSIHFSINLMNRTTELMLTKGIYIRAPYVTLSRDPATHTHEDSYLKGFIGKKRPLNVFEIMHLATHIKHNALGHSLLMGYSQVAKSKEVRKYFVRGYELAAKYVDIFQKVLKDEDLPSPSSWDTLPMASTISPFSDQLMLFHALYLNSIALGLYGGSLGTSPRRDLGVTYTRIMAEVLEFAEDGAQIMMNNGWFEEPPQAVDRKELANV